MEDCIFCKIVDGRIPSLKVYEDEKSLAFLDIYPANDGHTLLISKNHYENVFDIPEEELAYLHKVAKRLSLAVKSTVNADGINITQSNGKAAMQEVPHLHIHIIPRFENDGVMLGIMRKGNADKEFMKTLAEKIGKNIE